MKNLEILVTSSGNGRAEFKDVNNSSCAITESTVGRLTSQKLIWLTVGGSSMCLNRDQAKQVVRLIQRWIKTGSLYTNKD